MTGTDAIVVALLFGYLVELVFVFCHKGRRA